MGFNTTVVLYNDQTDRWPDEIVSAMSAWRRHELRTGRRFQEGGDFGWGRVVACEHADTDQVCVVGMNSGRYLTPCTPVECPADLEILAAVLRGHGYKVKAPTPQAAPQDARKSEKA